MRVAPPAADTLLRCHSCSHSVGYSAVPMRLVALFRASAFGQLRGAHVAEVRRRCRSCGWVNVFHPLTAREADSILVKQAS